MLKIEYKDIRPRFGQAVVRSDGSHVIRIDIGLSKLIQKFVLKHEQYHFKKLEGNFFKHSWIEEIMANLYGAYHEPMGFIRCLFKSLAWYRIMFYIERFRTKS